MSQSRIIFNILTDQWCNGADMSYAENLITDLSLSKGVVREYDHYKLPCHLDEWVSKISNIDTLNTAGSIYSIELDDARFLIKIPKSQKYNDSIERECKIGKCINKLRYIVPNFMYSFGLYSDPSSIFEMVEYIPGKTLEEHIQRGMAFSDFLNIFLQILIALEVAQRECKLSHFDAHTQNVILRPIDKKYKYTVLLDNKQYEIVAEKYIPVFVDFGNACVTTKQGSIGSNSFSKYGMMSYMVPASDMYKLLFYSYRHASGYLQRQIQSLFLFFGDEDPYKILISGDSVIDKIKRDFASQITFSKGGKRTPLQFATWILGNKDLNDSTNIKVKRRSIYRITHAPSHKQEKSANISEFLDILPRVSYIYTLYLHLVTGVKGEIIDKEGLMENDRQLFNSYKDVVIPDSILKGEYSEWMDQISKITINGRDKDMDAVRQFLKDSEFFREIDEYMNTIYTIREVKMCKEYKKMIRNFKNSEKYKIYKKFKNRSDDVERWALTISRSSEKN